MTGKLDAIEARIAHLRAALARRDPDATARDTELLRAMLAELDRDTATTPAEAAPAAEVRTRAADMLALLGR